MFHLFVFSSHMNCSIHSYSGGELTIIMIYMCTLSYVTTHLRLVKAYPNFDFGSIFALPLVV